MTTNATMIAGLARPDLAEAHRAVQRIYGPQSDGVWADLLSSAGLDGEETGPGAIERMLDAMRAGAPVTALCGEALAIRVASHDRLAQAQALIQDGAAS
ncbi:hypothetical protein [Cryptosporangium phraense]|uniref:Uncharacterized protein n=1 Tax=Cryptosporangium phraense TaxID=2593070 RepID=A0A545AHR2_9ACTN|nr:hypothetical protein [Cryptosporangium phraense]TQS40225.1 hypothetical protein FL583_35995 [Cryptosporangium phraense]